VLAERSTFPIKMPWTIHVQKSHKRAASALAQLKTDAIREEDRDLQRQMLQSNQQLIQSMASQIAPQAVTKEDNEEKPF
jgi:hypothetical protein